jgi:mRNA interferase RelE/StbE
MEIVLTSDARKDLKSIGRTEGLRIAAKLEAYAQNPGQFRNQVKKLQGINALRLRVGDYRILLNEDGIVLRVLRIKHRKDAYR